MRTLAAHCFSSTFSLVVHNNLAANIARNASAALRARVLPALMEGRFIGAFLLTEPQGGSDAAAIETRAVKTTGGWRLSGEKAWVSNGAVANTLSVYAQTDANAGSRGIGCFLVDADSPGVLRGDPYVLLGGHALATCGFSFDNCFVADEFVLLEPGKGFRAAMQGIGLARINVAAMCCGMLKKSLVVALESVSQRRAFGQNVAEFQGIQWMLADVATDLAAAEELTYDTAPMADEGQNATVQSAHAKKFSTRVALKGIAQCMQTMGAPGLTRQNPLARHLEAAKIAQFLDGTTEIQNVVLTRHLMPARSLKTPKTASGDLC